MTRTKISSRGTASERKSGSRVLKARASAVEHWLQRDVALAYDAMKADPNWGLSAKDVRASLAAAVKRTKKGRAGKANTATRL